MEVSILYESMRLLTPHVRTKACIIVCILPGPKSTLATLGTRRSMRHQLPRCAECQHWYLPQQNALFGCSQSSNGLNTCIEVNLCVRKDIWESEARENDSRRRAAVCHSPVFSDLLLVLRVTRRSRGVEHLQTSSTDDDVKLGRGPSSFGGDDALQSRGAKVGGAPRSAH